MRTQNPEITPHHPQHRPAEFRCYAMYEFHTWDRDHIAGDSIAEAVRQCMQSTPQPTVTLANLSLWGSICISVTATVIGLAAIVLGFRRDVVISHLDIRETATEERIDRLSQSTSDLDHKTDRLIAIVTEIANKLDKTK